jgi:phosphate transport system protein
MSGVLHIFHGLRSNYDREFSEIRSTLVEMSNRVDQAIDQSIQALYNKDTKIASSVIENDDAINRYRFNLEEECIALIATQQPAASDLREIIAVLYMIVEFERMGDYAAGIAKTVILMQEEPLLKTFKKFNKMADICRQMLAESMQAYLNRDQEKAREIAAKDQEIDALYEKIFERLIKVMAKEPEMVTRCTYLMWCAHNLERIADRVLNINEQTIFMATGLLRELE